MRLIALPANVDIKPEDLLIDGERTTAIAYYKQEDYPSNNCAMSDEINIETLEQARAALKDVQEYFAQSDSIIEKRVVVVVRTDATDDELRALQRQFTMSVFSEDWGCSIEEAESTSAITMMKNGLDPEGG